VLWLVILLLPAAVGLLVAALVTGQLTFAWGSIGVSVAAAVALLLRRRRSTRYVAAPVQDQESVQDQEPPDAERAAPAADGRSDSSDEPGGTADRTDPGVEETKTTDLPVLRDVTDEVLVVDEHPRYHLAHCAWLGSVPTEPLPVREARELGFTPCAQCRPDATLVGRRRAPSTA
jgi:hypothetical protein